MPITETKVVRRSTDTIPYFNDTVSTPSWIAELVAAGKLSKVITNSEDNLTQTTTIVYTDLDTYSRVETELLTINLDYNFLTYIANTEMTVAVPNQYTQSGIDEPFTCTTVYTFPEAGLAIHEKLISTINSDSKSMGQLLSLDHTDTTITAVHKYNNSENFTATYWADIMSLPGDEKLLVVEMHEVGATRTIKYEYV